MRPAADRTRHRATEPWITTRRPRTCFAWRTTDRACRTSAFCAPPLSCCFTITNICDAGERACYGRHACDGPEDCDTGVCCGEPSPSYESLGSSAANPLSTRCMDASECAAPNVRLCNGDGDCPSPDRCCPERHGGRIGLCAPECPGG